jgi:hypothetical protein
MSALTSPIFTATDAVTRGKLENCANGVPNEVVSHVSVGAQGEHVRLLQLALQAIANHEPAIGVPSFNVNGVYDNAFATAIAKYKTVRGLLNYAGAIDNIVGRKTIATLDKDVMKIGAHDGGTPSTPPRCLKADDCPQASAFTLQLFAELSNGYMVEPGHFILIVRDETHGILTRYLALVRGVDRAEPASGSPLGSPSPFSTTPPCKVANFFAFSMGYVSVQNPLQNPGSVLQMTLEYENESGIHSTPPFHVESGQIALPGNGGTFGQGDLRVLTWCHGLPGGHYGM